MRCSPIASFRPVPGDGAARCARHRPACSPPRRRSIRLAGLCLRWSSSGGQAPTPMIRARRHSLRRSPARTAACRELRALAREERDALARGDGGDLCAGDGAAAPPAPTAMWCAHDPGVLVVWRPVPRGRDRRLRPPPAGDGACACRAGQVERAVIDRLAEAVMLRARGGLPGSRHRCRRARCGCSFATCR